jgi:hypothetical protein
MDMNWLQNKMVLIAVGGLLVIGFAVFSQQPRTSGEENFDASKYYDGEPVAQEEIDTPGKQKEVEGIVGEQEPKRVSNAKVYDNAKYGLQITPPPGWIMSEDGENDTVAYFLSPTFEKEGTLEWQTSINLGVIGGNTGFSVSEYVEAFKTHISQTFSEFSVVSEGKRTLDGRKAIILSATFTNDGHKFRNYMVFIIKGDNAYNVTATALNSTWATYEKALKDSALSFAVK